MKDFSVRWTGLLKPAESGTYQIGLMGSMQRLWIDGKLVIDDAIGHDPNPQLATLQLTKGHAYPVKIEYMAGGRTTKLIWLPVGGDPLVEAVAAAREADVVVAVVGITSKLEGEEMKVEVPGFKGGDRTNLNLPEEESALLGALEGRG